MNCIIKICSSLGWPHILYFPMGGKKKKKDGCASNYVLLDGCAGFTARMDCEQMWEA